MQREISQFSLRSDGNFSHLRCRTVRYYESFVPSTFKLWNDFSLNIRNGPIPYEQNFDLDKSRQKFHHSLKEHHKISNIPKFRCEML
jgi:hypothetical protein